MSAARSTDRAALNVNPITPVGLRQRWRGLSSSERIAIYSFLVVPMILFIVPALFGHPAIDADNLVQNYPLRVLVGRDLRGGHLPLFNPYSNSGTPLLAGMNAGAFYPLIALFVILPGVVAWTANLIVVYFVAALGTYVLGRSHGFSPRASAISAYSYAYGGALIGQIVHLGVIQGFSFLPWVILVLTGLSRRLSRTPASWRALLRASVPYTLGGTLLWALIDLTGEPRAIAESELVYLVGAAVIVVVRSSYRPVGPRRIVTYLLTLGLGGAWGAGVALAQLLPGWAFIHASERAHISYSFYGAGSLAPRWSMLYLVPDLFGGNGSVGTGFFAPYNLPEVTVYVGLIALLAGFAFLSRITWRGWRGADLDVVLYLVVAVVGLFASWGNDVVTGHLFHALPLFGSTRLPSRNGVLVDLGFAMLLAWWIHHLETEDRDSYGLRGVRRVVTLLPAIAIGATAVSVMVWGRRLMSDLGVQFHASDVTLLTPIMCIRLALAVVAILVIVLAAGRRRLVEILAFLVVVDLVLFSFLDATGLVGGPGPTQPSSSYAGSVLGRSGRFALVDQGGVHTAAFRKLGEPNMNVFTGLASVQGYGSLIENYYGVATGSHPQNGLSSCHLADGDFAQLRLSAVAVASSLLISNTEFGRNAVPTSCIVRRASRHDARYFGQVLSVHAVDVQALSTRPVTVTLQLLNSSGHGVGRSYRERLRGSTNVVLSRDIRGAGFSLSSSSPLEISSASVETTSGVRYTLNSNFQLALDEPSWHLSSVTTTFAVFHSTHLDHRYRTVPSSEVRQGVSTASGFGSVLVTSSHPVTLIRSEEYLPGWRASATSPSGATTRVTVVRRGLVQAVRLPPGKWRVRFYYHAPYIVAGLLGSALSSVALVVAWWWSRRRTRLDTMLS